MTRAELLRRFILNAVCDDYEELEMIYYCVYRDATECHLWIERADVMDALMEAVESGFVKAYRVRAVPPKVLEVMEGMPSAEERETPFTIWYYLTPKGKQLHMSDDDDLPWDEQGRIKEGWVGPEGWFPWDHFVPSHVHPAGPPKLGNAPDDE